MKRTMVKVYLLITILQFSAMSFSQQIVSLHPFIGDTITSEEAFDFYLFQDSTIGKYDYAIVFLENAERYRVIFYGDTIGEMIIDSSQVVQYTQNIEKIHQYLCRNRDEKSISIEIDSLLIQSVELKLMTPERKKKMVYDARVYNMKKLAADERCLFGGEREDFINCTGGYIWSRKKKKDK